MLYGKSSDFAVKNSRHKLLYLSALASCSKIVWMNYLTSLQIGEKAESWVEAQMNCGKLGANLASIHNTQVQYYIY